MDVAVYYNFGDVYGADIESCSEDVSPQCLFV